ncbi:Os10g0103700, partial [Oryza sativa Japonica Group]
YREARSVKCRTKLKQTEVDCELLKRCCETLTEENRRLHRELQQLRALTHSAAADRTNKPTAPHLFSPFAKSAAC